MAPISSNTMNTNDRRNNSIRFINATDNLIKKKLVEKKSRILFFLDY